MTSLAVRGEVKLTNSWLVRAAILDAVPGDPDWPRRTAVKPGARDGALAAVELSYLDDRTKAAVGYWRYTGRFETIAADGSASDPARSRGNHGFYAFVQSLLTQEGADREQGLTGWVRLGFANERLNPIGRYVGGGLAYFGPLADAMRTKSALHSAWPNSAVRSVAALAGDVQNRREVIVETTYRAPVLAWLTLPPDLQYVIDPGGQRSAANALIFGLRAEVGF